MDVLREVEGSYLYDPLIPICGHHKEKWATLEASELPIV